MSTNGHIKFTKDVTEVDEEIGDSHTNISTDRYVDNAQCEYKVIFFYENMSTRDLFQEQSFENNAMKEQGVVEEPMIFEDASEASTTSIDLVNNKAIESATSNANFCSQDEIIRITDDPFNHLNASDDAQIKLKPHTNFVDVNDANKFSMVIFVGLAA